MAVVVAHPDDETLWAGGVILMRREWSLRIATLCRRSDPDRSRRFLAMLGPLGAEGGMGDLDDGPEQRPLHPEIVEHAVVSLLPPEPYTLLMTHGPHGEYTRHRRHEETCRAVVSAWAAGRIAAEELWMFAYEDGEGRYLPRAVRTADEHVVLPKAVWRRKYSLITAMYGFSPDSWEARITPKEEAFWRFETPESATQWIERQGDLT